MLRRLNIGLATILLSAPIFLFLAASQTLAAVRCETQYGGGQVCVTTGQLQVNKKVWDQDTASYVDNIVASGTHRFVAGEEVIFQIKISNVGNTNLDNVVFSDSLPSYLAYVSGKMSENLGTLYPGQTVERIIKARVVNASQLPLAPSTVCDDRTTNFAQAYNGDSSDQDTSRVCVENRVLGKTTVPAKIVTPVKTIPQTGPEQLVLLGLGLAGAAGVYLKAKFKSF